MEGPPNALHDLKFQTEDRKKIFTSKYQQKKKDMEKMWDMKTEAVPMDIGACNRRSVSN